MNLHIEKQMRKRVPPEIQPKENKTQPVNLMRPDELKKMETSPQKKDKILFQALAVEEGGICLLMLKRKPVGVGNSFQASVDTLYCFTRIKGADTPVKITHVWYFGGTEMASVDLPVKSSNWRTYSAKTIPSHKTGDWHVDVLDPEYAVLQTLHFKITP